MKNLIEMPPVMILCGGMGTRLREANIPLQTYWFNKGMIDAAKGESAILYLAIKPFTAATGEKLVLSVNGYEKERTMTKDVTFTAGKIKILNFSYDKIQGPVEGSVDVLNRELTGIEENSSAYESWSGKTSNTSAVYAGQSAGRSETTRSLARVAAGAGVIEAIVRGSSDQVR